MPNGSSIPFQIDMEFQALIPPLSAEEYRLLEASLQAEGCREPLAVWFQPDAHAFCDHCNQVQTVDCVFDYMFGFADDTEKEWFLCCAQCQRAFLFDAEMDGIEQEEIPCLLLDGHHRHEICERLGITYDVHPFFGLASREEAHRWILQNQLARRNLADIDRVALALQLKPLLEAQAKLRQGTRTDLGANLPQSPDTREQVADLAGVSERTVDKAVKILTAGAPEVLQATRFHDLSLHAAVPLTDLPKAQQTQALQEAIQEADGKKPTAVQTRAVVSRAQVVATVKEQLAAGKTPQQAVAHALQQHEITLATPALADALAQATDRQVLLPATDGFLHDGRTKAEEVATMAQTRRMFQLFNALEGLATLPDLEALIAEIPDYSAYRIEQHLDQAQTNLTRFASLWKERNHAVTPSIR